MPFRLFTYVLLIFCLLPGIINAQECSPANGEPLVIGALFPQETLLTVRSGDSFNGAEAMRQAMNGCGGVNGRPVEWEMMPARDRYSAIESVQALKEANIPVVVGSGSSAVSAGAQEGAQASEIVYWEVSESIDKSDDWTFSPRPNNYQLGVKSAQFVEAQYPDARIALVYEERQPTEVIVAGILDTLSEPPVLKYSYDNEFNRADMSKVAVELREQELDVVLLVTFEGDGYWLWYQAREANANVDAWLHVGSEGYWRGLCSRERNVQGFMALAPYAPASESYRDAAVGEINRLYRGIYQRKHSSSPSLQADLSASGVYLLLRYVLPSVEGDFTAENVRAAIATLDIESPVGLMGEGLAFEGGLNTQFVAPVRQQQSRNFCTVFPSDIATCLSSIQSFPTWRERAVSNDNWQCNPEA